MQKVEVEENKVRIFINQSFYDIESVRRVKKVFEGIGKIITVEGKTITVVDIIPYQKMNTAEMEMIGYEFYNHLLDAVKSKDE